MDLCGEVGYNIDMKRVGTIKNYTTYYNKLLAYAELCGVKVYFAELKDNEQGKDMGEYLYKNRSINLNKKMTEKETLAVLLHELGHFMDDKINPKSRSTERAYEKLNNNKKLTPHQRELIIRCERVAWEYGEGLAKKFKIPLGSWFYNELQAGMSNYYSLKT